MLVHICRVCVLFYWFRVMHEMKCKGRVGAKDKRLDERHCAVRNAYSQVRTNGFYFCTTTAQTIGFWRAKFNFCFNNYKCCCEFSMSFAIKISEHRYHSICSFWRKAEILKWHSFHMIIVESTTLANFFCSKKSLHLL